MNPLAIFLILLACVIAALYLGQMKYLKQLSSAMIVIILAAILANFGVIPTSSTPTPLYDGIFKYIAPMAIFYLMLSVNLKSLKKAGMPMIGNFFLGALGIMVGVLVGMWAVDGKMRIGENFYAVGGMFTGTFIGGSINLNAVALHYNVTKDGSLYAAITAIDNIMTAIWVMATIAIPKMMKKILPTKRQGAASNESYEHALSDIETVNPLSISWLLFIGYGSLFVSQELSKMFKDIPMVIFMTTIALTLAQIPIIQRIKGNKLMGMLCVYLFLAVIGAYCDIPALIKNGDLALTLITFVLIIVSIHSVFQFGIGYLLKQDWDVMGIASQANLGGSSTCLVCAQSLGRDDLGLAGILVGALGNAVGTYCALLMAKLLQTIF
jgi:uncharacterized membrane protein